MMETIAIDRFEGDIAVCERVDLTTFNIRIADLPTGAKPGSILTISNEGIISFDMDEETERRKRITKLYMSILTKEDLDEKPL